MGALQDLFDSKLPSPTDEQDRVNRQLRGATERDGLRWREPDGPITPVGLHVVLGLMVAWNDYERRLLVELERAFAGGQTESDLIEIFNADQITSIEELQTYIPGWREGMSSPWLGVWADGEQWFRLSGAAAMTWVCDRYGIVSV